MTILRRWSVSAFFSFLVLAGIAVDACGGQKESEGKASAAPEKWRVDRSLTLTPRGESIPALAYRVWPMTWERKEGNAVPIYLRLNHEQTDAARHDWSETPKKWLNIPIKDIPLAEAKKFLGRYEKFLRQLELGAERKNADWNYTLDQGSVIDILLPDAQMMRGYAPMLLLKVRVELAENHYAAAAHWLQTGFAFSQHVGNGPFLINRLVGLAIADQFLDGVFDFIQQPGAPNLYWPLAQMPHPLISLREGLDFEYHVVEMEFRELGDLNRTRSPEEWDALLRKVRTELVRLTQGASSRQRWWDAPIRGAGAQDPASESSELPEARKYLVSEKKLSPDKVNAMSPAEILVLYMMGVYEQLRDEWFKGAYLPYPQAEPALAKSEVRVNAAPQTEGKRLTAFLPAIAKVKKAQIRIARKMAALQVIESLRLYAANHDGRLPDKLDDVSAVPVANDPATEKPFEYQRDGDGATLIGRVPGDSLEETGLRFHLVMRKK